MFTKEKFHRTARSVMSKESGFTLGEFAVTLGAVAILTAVLIPTIAGVVEKARVSSAKQECLATVKAMIYEGYEIPKIEEYIFVSSGYAYRYVEGKLISVQTELSRYRRIDEGGSAEVYRKLFACGHGWKTVYCPESDPGCAREGNVAHWACEVCGAAYCDEQGSVVAENVSVAALEHDWDDVLQCRRCMEVLPEDSAGTSGLSFEYLPGGAFVYAMTNVASGTTAIVIPRRTRGALVVGTARGCFSGSDIESVTVPVTVKSLGANSFSYCSSLTCVNLSEGLEEVGESCFYFCMGLTKIDLPKSLKSLENEAFFGCYKLKTVTYAGSKAEWAQVSKGEDWMPPRLTRVICSDGEVELS